MTVIPLGPGLPQGSSHLPADLSEPLTARLRAQHPPIWCCSGWRLPRFTRRTFLRKCGDSSLWPYSSSSPQASPRLVRTAVSRHPALWSPDFPLRALRHAATVWPASHGNFNTCAPTAIADSAPDHCGNPRLLHRVDAHHARVLGAVPGCDQLIHPRRDRGQRCQRPPAGSFEHQPHILARHG